MSQETLWINQSLFGFSKYETEEQLYILDCGFMFLKKYTMRKICFADVTASIFCSSQFYICKEFSVAIQIQYSLSKYELFNTWIIFFYFYKSKKVNGCRNGIYIHLNRDERA